MVGSLPSTLCAGRRSTGSRSWSPSGGSPGFRSGCACLPLGGGLVAIEGEFKAASLTEAGFPAVGLSSFFGFATKAGEELTALIARLQLMIAGR